ncbi:hypothetical protein JCGZ_14359 [Jatropha curcas]|uniref:Glycosyltransferase n=1 Tax=Jatropha curcas TaxID=180498 RepID=A0A067K0I7_JATCU|nr:hypothetical protein JCGZ_14359 [Jatropha curcas]
MHVVILPWSAFGHIMPFFQFAIALAKVGIEVSFVSTPRNIKRLPKLSSSNLETQILFVELPLPTLSGKYPLREGGEAIVDIAAENIQYLKIAYDQLQYPFKQFIARKMPNWIVVDFCSYWAADIAKEYSIPLLYLSVFSDFPSSIAFRSYEARSFHPGFYGENASGIKDAERVARTMAACRAALVRSCTEFEGEYLNIYRKILGKPVIPIGLLPPEKPDGKRETLDGIWRKIFEWLDNQEEKSVVFAGFGSECKLTKDQVYEIAYGLELSELPFLWALRKPSWAVEDNADVLPAGFRDRTSERGKVCIGWAPQQEILAHPSIGGSLFHSGWGSVIETLQYGHCLIVLPFIVDQGVNAKLLVEKGLALEVDRKSDGSFTRNDISKSLRLAMVSLEGKKLRDRAKEASAIFGDENLHRNYIASLVEYMRNGV